MPDAFDFQGEEGDDAGDSPAKQQQQDVARQIARCVPKLRGSSKATHLKALSGLLEQLPQHAASLGPGSARDALLECLVDRSTLHSKAKDVRMYAAACFAQLLRIYAPDTPYDNKQLEPVFELLLWSVEQLQEHRAPTFELGVSILQTISQTKSYFVMLDWGDEDVVLDWVRALLQCINAGSSMAAGPHVLEVLSGIVGDDSTSEAVLELLLSHLVPPKSQDNPLACQMVQAVLRACEGVVKPTLQRILTTLIRSPISSNSDLHQQCYALIYQLYLAVPQVLLPVMPHLTSELDADSPAQRLEATQLLGRLLSLPGNKLVSEYQDVLDTLLLRYADPDVTVRLAMMDFTPALVAAAGGEAQLQRRVLLAAAQRLRDGEERVRLAAVKAVCTTARQLLTGPAPSAGAAGGPGGSGTTAGLLSPIDALLGSMGSQEDVDAAAADLGLADAPAWQQQQQQQHVGAGSGGGAASAAAAVRDVPFVQEALRSVYLRLRDTKFPVRRAAAQHFLATFRAVAAAGDGAQVGRCCWLVARVCLCAKADLELRGALYELTAQHGLLAPKTPPSAAAAAWTRLWLTSSEVEREALLLLLGARMRLQVDSLVALSLRRKLSGRQSAAAAAAAGDEDGQADLRAELQRRVQLLAAQLPRPDSAREALGKLMEVRDNHAFGALQQALAPDGTQEASAKARADALARVGSRGAAAEAVSQLLLWGRPAAWLPAPVLHALMDLAAGDPDSEQAELVGGAYELLLSVSKAAPTLFAGLVRSVHEQLVCSAEPELAELGVLLLVRSAAQQRKVAAPLSASPDAATAQLVQQQVLPLLRAMCRGRAAPAPTGGSQGSARGCGGGGAGVVLPKAAKWAALGLVALQPGSAGRQELTALGDELAGGLDAAAAETAAQLQALSVAGQYTPDAFGRHVEQLLHFVTEDYWLAYLDAAAGGAPAAAAATPCAPGARGGSGGSSSRRRRRSQNSSLQSAGGGGASQQAAGGGAGSQAEQQAAAAAMKGGALKALAAGCVPKEGHEVPVETLRAVARLAEFLEGLLEPGEEFWPAFLADAPPETAGQLRLAAAGALLRLARRHDVRFAATTYCGLALVMQDEREEVRAGFAAKLFKLVRHFQQRGGSRQLPAKYAAMLPLAAADPFRPNKDAAARMLRCWVAEQRALVAASMAAAARGSRAGGSTMQEQPEMMVPYCLYILAHHPDFPQGEDADEPAAYEPFQFMLQFMLQPLLVACGSSPAGATIGLLLKMWRWMKNTADTSDPPATTQLYCLCDMAAATTRALAADMQLPQAADYPGGVVLPRSLLRPLDKSERGADLSYLPPGFEVVRDPEPAAALAAPMGNGAAAGPHSRGTKARGAAAAAATAAAGGRGSKRRAAAEAGDESCGDAAADGDKDSGGKRAKRTRGAAGGRRPARGGGGGGGGGATRGGKAAAEGGSSDDGWGSDSGENVGAAGQHPDHMTHRQQVLAQHKAVQQQQHQEQHGDSIEADAGAEDGPADTTRALLQATGHHHHHQQQQAKQRQLKQQPIGFTAAADASSPAPARRTRQAAPEAAGRSLRETRQQQQHSSSSSSQGAATDEASGGVPPAPPPVAAAATAAGTAVGQRGAQGAPRAGKSAARGGGRRRQQPEEAEEEGGAPGGDDDKENAPRRAARGRAAGNAAASHKATRGSKGAGGGGDGGGGADDAAGGDSDADGPPAAAAAAPAPKLRGRLQGSKTRRAPATVGERSADGRVTRTRRGAGP